MNLINKDALVAEIKKHQAIWDGMDDDYCKGQRLAYSDVISFLDTLEVKEVREESVSKDLEEAAFDYAEACKYDGGEKLLCVEHFKAGAQWQKQQNALEVKEVDLDVEQRMKECPYRQVGCTMYEGHILECNGACSWVVDYPKLKELKAQKGE